jgi:putative hydrolase of the HAD superfamily
MNIRAIVFDIGGVLEINPETGWESKWEKRLHLSLQEIDEKLIALGLNGALGPCTELEWIQGLREVTGMDLAQTEAFMSDLWYWYLGTLNSELAAFFTSLRPRFQTAILSNSHVGAREREQALYHFHEMTDQIIYSHEVGLAKPDWRIYELTCQRLNVRPHEMIFLDDVPANIKAALDYGIQGILFTGNEQAMMDIQNCCLG